VWRPPNFAKRSIIHDPVRAGLAITGGIQTAGDPLKAMMVGARVAMMTSALLENRIDIRGVLTGVTSWMQDHEYNSIRQMQGTISRRAVPDSAAFERSKYMRVFSSYALKKRCQSEPF
jgi:dihydroorotate dehydrogenase (fumarate)